MCAGNAAAVFAPAFPQENDFPCNGVAAAEACGMWLLPAPENAMKMRLLTKMLLFVLVPALIGLVVAAVNYGASRNTLRAQLMEDLDTMANLQLSELRTASTLLRGVLRSTTDVPQIVAYLEALAGGAPADTLKELEQRAPLTCGT